MKRLADFWRRGAVALVLMAAAATAVAELQLPVPPPTLRLPQERAAYIVMRFWDAMDFKALPAGEEPLEQDFVNFLSISAIAPADSARVAMGRAARIAAAAERSADFASLAAKYLLGEGSPLRDEAFFLTVADSLLSHGGMGDAERIRLGFLRDETAKALPGTQAPELRGVTDTAAEFDLAAMPASMRLLMFYDPDCDTCHATLRQLMDDPVIAGAIAVGSLKPVAVYADDDEEAWRRAGGSFPSGWLNVNAPDAGERYSIPSMPTLYLLAPDGTVVLREASVEALREALR